MILRKGAIAAHEGEKVLIPINMRDGSVLAYGKGNAVWIFSAPHGAGRLMSRTKAKNPFAVEMPHFNRQTIDAMEEARRISRDPEIKGYHSMEELKAALEAD